MVNLKKKKKVKIIDDDNVDNSTPSTSAATPFKPRTARKRIKTEIKSEPIEVSNVHTPTREVVDIATTDVIFHMDDDPNEERRIDPRMPECGTYTKKRFLEFYGEYIGEIAWHNAWKLPENETQPPQPQAKPEEEYVSPLNSPIHITIDDDVNSQADTDLISEPECSRDCVCRSCIKFEEVGCTINTVIKGGGCSLASEKIGDSDLICVARASVGVKFSYSLSVYYEVEMSSFSDDSIIKIGWTNDSSVKKIGPQTFNGVSLAQYQKQSLDYSNCLKHGGRVVLGLSLSSMLGSPYAASRLYVNGTHHSDSTIHVANRKEFFPIIIWKNCSFDVRFTNYRGCMHCKPFEHPTPHVLLGELNEYMRVVNESIGREAKVLARDRRSGKCNVIIKDEKKSFHETSASVNISTAAVRAWLDASMIECTDGTLNILKQNVFELALRSKRNTIFDNAKDETLFSDQSVYFAYDPVLGDD